jgi:mannitol-1-/sugar-/sorbitol-6-/2-deoxyglucose-6-phosphatase
MIRAAIFDMDGLLIDSEPLWTRAEIEVFETVGIDLDETSCAETIGMGLDDVVSYRYNQKPFSNRSQLQVARAIHQRVAELIKERGQAMPGAHQALEFVKARGARLGLATASDRVLIDATMSTLNIEGVFDHIQSASELTHGKPHPEVYLTAASALGTRPDECLGLEDSIPGTIAIKAAGMKAIAIPEKRLVDDPRFSIADVVLGSLEQLNQQVWDSLQ